MEAVYIAAGAGFIGGFITVIAQTLLKRLLTNVSDTKQTLEAERLASIYTAIKKNNLIALETAAEIREIAKVVIKHETEMASIQKDIEKMESILYVPVGNNNKN